MAYTDSVNTHNMISRRELFSSAARSAGVIAAAAALPGLIPSSASAGPAYGGGNRVRELVKTLHHGMTEEQKKLILFPFEHRRRRVIGNNWYVVKPKIGEIYTPDQQELMKEIIKKVSSEQGYEKFMNVMETDSGGYLNYHAALFGDPDQGKFEWVLSGRHLTLRADANSVENAALGGPILYGHAPVTFNENKDHIKNAFWYQAIRANHVFNMLDGKQQAQALIAKAPIEDSVALQGTSGTFQGIQVSSLSRDQKAEVMNVLSDLLIPFAKPDADHVLACLKAGGGADSLRMAFYQEGDIGNDRVWDLWRLEGPNFVWYFRGEPHVHTWVNVASTAPGPMLMAHAGNIFENDF